MKLVLGAISLVLGLLSLIVLTYLSWIFHSSIHRVTDDGGGDISPVVVGELFPIALPLTMIMLGIFLGLFRINRRNKIGKKLSIAGVALSVLAILVVIVPFFFLP